MDGVKTVRIIGNIIWLLFGGIVWLWLDARRVDLCITIIGIPFGVQCFKIGALVLWPFAGKCRLEFWSRWIASQYHLDYLFRMGTCFIPFYYGLLFCITIVGIPFGLQHFKLAKLGLVPFGARIN